MPRVSSDSESHRTQLGSSPLISIVIPVYNIAPYLTECLDSITQQEFRDIEIIAVDGGSTDSSAAILDERREKEPRLSVIHASRIGPGMARNLGTARANGEYIWFVDGDDTLASGCLDVIADHLETTRPDLLLVNYETVSPGGKLEPSPAADQMRTMAKHVFTLAEQPWVTELSMASWNKIVRRDFFDAVGVTFWTDWPHEDVPLSGMLLLEASRVNAVGQICYRYRTHRSGSAIEAGRRDRHFQVFQAWQFLLDELRKRVESGDQALTSQVYRAFFDRAIGHCWAVLSTPGFVASGDRRTFFDKMHMYYVQYAPNGYRPARGHSLRFRLVKANVYPLYAVLAWLKRGASPRNPIRSDPGQRDH